MKQSVLSTTTLTYFCFFVDLVKVTENSRLSREKREKRRAKVRQDLNMIREMRGTPEFNLATPELSDVIEVSATMIDKIHHSLSVLVIFLSFEFAQKHVVPYKRQVGDSGKFVLPLPSQRLSVGRYRTIKDLGVVLKEERSISDIQDVELDYAEKTFPVIAMELEHNRSNGIFFERSRSISSDQLRGASRGNSAGLATASWRSRPKTTGSSDGGYAFPLSSISPDVGEFEHFPMPTDSVASYDQSQETVYKTGGQLDIDSVNFSNVIDESIIKDSDVINEEAFPSITGSERTTTAMRPKSREDLIYDVILSRNDTT